LKRKGPRRRRRRRKKILGKELDYQVECFGSLGHVTESCTVKKRIIRGI
jgi:hypothetical protein